MFRRDVLLDPPAWLPRWVPSSHRPRSIAVLQLATGVVLTAGVVACASEGADAPADPTFAPDAVDVDDAERASVCATPDETFAQETEALVSTFGVIPVTVTTGDDAVELCVLVASTPEQRARGLMEVGGFDGFDGMVFTYDADSSGAYYMFDTPTPLTISWWEHDGDLVSVTDMEPCLDLPAAECPRYPPTGPYRYALEVPLGALDGHLDDTSVLSLGPAR